MGANIAISDNDEYYVELGKNYDEDECELRSFRLRNFKAFRDSGWITLNRMTIVYGDNSAGKTALFYFIRLMWRCYRERENGLVFYDSSRMRDSIGSFDELIYGKADKGDGIEIILRFSSKLYETVEYAVRLTATQAGTDATVSSATIKCNGRVIDIFGSENYSIENLFFIVARGDSEINDEFAVVKAVQQAILQLMRRFQVIGSKRYSPERKMPLSGNDYTQVGLDGVNSYEMLYNSSAMGDRKEIVDEWLDKFGYSYYWKSEDGVGQFILKNNKTDIETNIVDNGFGIAQSLPIAVAIAAIKDKDFVFVDSPEAFLQTRMQAEMMDLLLKAKPDCRMILETGSEYMMIRLRRRIAENYCNSGDFSVYFVHESDDKETVIDEIKMDKVGNFIDAPEDFLSFFSTNFEDLMLWEEASRTI